MDVRELQTLAKPEHLAKLRLQTDDFWNKMTANQTDYYARESVRIGEEIADLFLQEYGDLTIREIAVQCQLRIRKDTSPLVTETPDFVGNWFAERQRISIHAGIASLLIELLASFGILVPEEEAFRFLFLRSFFPYFAEKKNLLPSRTLDPMEVRVLFSTKEFPVRMTDKAAADRFVDKAMHFPVSAGLLPYLQLVVSGRTDLNHVGEMLKRG